MATKVEQVISGSWTPEVIVSLVGEIAWPLVLIILGWRFKSGIVDGVGKFFSKNNVTEVSATTTGLTAKFKEAQQTAKSKENASEPAAIPEGVSYAELIKRQESHSSEHSLQLYEHIKSHVDSLKLEGNSAIELLSKELSLLQAGLAYFDINKTLFRSQFDLLNSWLIEGEISEDNLKAYFDNLLKNNPGILDGWDYIKYITYPVSRGLIEYKEGNYTITVLGKSYVQFMKQNIQFIDELSNL
ncbi:hypothetical protein KO505_14455 [Psychrosphaera sp. F3M07]|uniref:hypothetical protein n=1 Tax=Psychrosphaera sp. F3M07 TaxID=2841560 RepID=UPI001C08D30F|nr:hypothetical protein [Psychrosphaera sp. F3M07]MBU2919145.1 hypothetical protein [Psychrosphaera sp. F3M07]